MDDCCIWPGTGTAKGYRRLRVNGRLTMVHRYAWEMWVGPIPDGMVIDHLCRNRACYNLDHLRVCTNGENVGAPGSRAISQTYKARTHCAHGHEFTAENTLRFASDPTRRRCRICAEGFRALEKAKPGWAERQREYQRRHRLKAQAER